MRPHPGDRALSYVFEFSIPTLISVIHTRSLTNRGLVCLSHLSRLRVLNISNADYCEKSLIVIILLSPFSDFRTYRDECPVFLSQGEFAPCAGRGDDQLIYK